MATIIQLRRDTAANWTSNDPLLADGEYGYETDTRRAKIGNGIDEWTQLSYLSVDAISNWGTILGTLSDQTDLQNALDLKAEQIDDLSDVVLTAEANTDVLQYDGANWVNVDVATVGVTDHTGLTNIGTNTHDQIDTHIADGTVHFTEASIDHVNILNIGTNTHAQIDTHIADLGNPHSTKVNNLADISLTSLADTNLLQYDGANWVNVPVESVGVLDHTNLTSIGTNTHAQIDTHIADGTIHYEQSAISITESQISNLQDYLVNVIEDPTPQLGGDLETLDNDVILQTSTLTEAGRILTSADDIGVIFARTTDSTYNPNDGGIYAGAGVIQLNGGVATVNGLAGSSNRQVYVNENGSLYSVEPPVPDWTVSDSDTAIYSMPTLGQWVRMTGLEITTPEDMDAGEAFNISANIHITNDSTRFGTVAVGVGIDGAQPSATGVSVVLTADFDSVVPINISSITAVPALAGTLVSIWVQRESEEQNQFNPVAAGTPAPAHELIVSTIKGGGSISDHGQLTSIGVNTHDQIDTHIAQTAFFHDADKITFDDTIVGSGNTNVQDTIDFLDGQISLRETAATGVQSGGLVSELSSTSVSIASGVGEIVDGYTDRANPTRTLVTWPTTPSLVIDMPETIGAQVIYIDDLGQVQQSGTSLTPQERRSFIQLAAVYYKDGVIESVQEIGVLSNEATNTVYDFLYFTPVGQRTSGLGINPVTSVLSIWADNGQLLSPGAGVTTDIKNPNFLTLGAIGDSGTPATFDVLFADGTVFLANQTVIPKYYESAPGVATALPNNEATIMYVLRAINNTLIIQLGQNQYNDGKEARDSLEVDRSSFVHYGTGVGFYLPSAQVYIDENATDFDDSNLAGIVSLIGAGTGASGGVAVNDFLSLSDVDDSSYAGKLGQAPLVNSSETGLLLGPVVQSDTTNDLGSDQIGNMVSLTQAEYDALTPNATTMYVIKG